MKTLILISALIISNLIFGQEQEINLEISTSGNKMDEFQVFLGDGQKFNYLTPKIFDIYGGTAQNGFSQDNPNNVKKVIDLGGSSIDKFYKDVKNNKAQIIIGYYHIKIDFKDTINVHKILDGSRSTQEVLMKLAKLQGVSRYQLKETAAIEEFNPKIEGAEYYTINEFYYTIEKFNSGYYYVDIMFPIGKERRIND